MAQTKKFSEFLVEIGDGLTPTEGFAAPCGLRSRGWERTNTMNESQNPSCPPDEDEPADTDRDVVSRSSSISGAGVVADEDFDVWDEWCDDGSTKNVRITLGARQWVAPMKCASLNIQGERGQRVNFTVSLVSDGGHTKTAP